MDTLTISQKHSIKTIKLRVKKTILLVKIGRTKGMSTVLEYQFMPLLDMVHNQHVVDIGLILNISNLEILLLISHFIKHNKAIVPTTKGSSMLILSPCFIFILTS